MEVFVGKLLDLYQSQLAEKAEDADADDRAHVERTKQAHEIGSDIGQLASKLQRYVKPHTVDETTVTVNDGAGSEITIDVFEPNAADPGACYRVVGSEGEIAEYDEEGLFEFLIDWIKTRPKAA
jgi:hypothetical protein